MVAELREIIATDPNGVESQIARLNLIAFTKRLFPTYRAAAHHWRIAAALQAVEAGEVDRLVVTLPPRHGKSALASHHFPAWYLGRNPDKRIIAASYSAGLAYRFSRLARNLLRDPMWPFPGIETAGDWAAVQSWDIDGHRGGYVSAGVGGSITGHGADLLLIDDAVASAEEAESEAYRERAWEWFTQTALTRLEPGGAVVLIGTRWHQDDLIGRALAMAGAGWTHVDLPALDDDGNALWPERFDAAALHRIREQIGSRAFASLYQQRPSPAEGTILKREWWRHWRDPLPDIEWMIQAFDTAFKTGQSNDYSVCLTLGLAGGGFYLLDLWRDRVEFPALERAVRDQFVKWSPDEIIVEDAGSGQSVIQQLQRTEDDRLTPWQPAVVLPITGYRPDKDKLARANAISPYVEGGRVFLPSVASWTDAFVEECAAFPFASHDDQVDALTMGLLNLVRRAAVLRPVSPQLAAHFTGMPR